MALAYTKEFLIEAFLSRYEGFVTGEKYTKLRQMSEELYDRVGRNEFRRYASLTPEAIKEYKEKCENSS